MEQLSISLRPTKLSELFGQDIIVKGLTQRFLSNKIPKAFLLRGPYGTGKTTVSEIIAMTINCSNKNGIDPCCNCSSCKKILEERYDDEIIYLDAGKTGKKDDVNEILESVDITPFSSLNRIFIIEEADSLTKAAKDSLYKVLESKQDRIYFIFLSMGTGSFNSALLSRMQIYDFQPFSVSEIMTALQNTLKKLGIWGNSDIPKEFFLDTLRGIAESSNGSMRQAIQLLDKCINEKLYSLSEIRKAVTITDVITIKKSLLDLLDNKKSAIPDMFNLDITGVFNYSYSVLLDAYVYSISGHTENPYYEKEVAELSTHGRLKDLLKIFDEIFEKSSYLRKEYILSKLAQFQESLNTRKVI